MCSREPPGPVEGAPINPQRYVPLHEIVYEMGEIAIVKNDDAGSWVVGVETVELGIAICVVSGRHGEADVAHEYAKNKMRLLSSLEGLCAIFVPFFIPVLVGKSGTLPITEADSVL